MSSALRGGAEGSSIAGIDAPDSYLICSTPRTGSTLLCALLRSTGVAGRPESYFRAQDEATWANAWGLESSDVRGVAYGEFVRAALTAGRSENGVFGARIMWGTMDEIVGRLRQAHPEVDDSASSMLEFAFGRLRFVWLTRRDVVAQAVSRLRAEQTNVWHISDAGDHRIAEGNARYDFEQIRGFVAEANDHNEAWRVWFDRLGASPHRVDYEDLDADAVSVVDEILEYLGFERSTGRDILASNQRLADATSAEWAERYRYDAGRRA